MANDLPPPPEQSAGNQPSPLPGNQQPQPPTEQKPFRRQYEQPFKRVGANQYGLVYKPLGKGSLVVAKYDFWKHDPYPLILVSSIYSDQRLAGVNLHYLTYKYVRNLLQNYCDKRSFGYPLIKGDKYIVQAFRTYKKAGLRQARILDCEFVLNAMGIARSYSPNEIEKIRQHIQQQLRQEVNPRSDDLVNRHGKQFMNAVTPQQDYGHGRNTKADNRAVPNLPITPQVPNSATIPPIPPTGNNV